MEVLRITDVGADRLLIEAVDTAGEVITATGWVSATTTHYPANAYNSDGTLKQNAKPRQMTDAERMAYAASLLQPVTQPNPGGTVLFATADADERLKGRKPKP